MLTNTSNPFIGIGLRHPHYDEVLSKHLPIEWFEVHSENYFLPGSPALQKLLAIRKDYPISLHGVGLSLGTAEGLDEAHLRRIRDLIQLVDPFLISEHLSWNRAGGISVPDLLPLPYHEESLAILSQNIDHAQNILQRELLIENPSSYLTYPESTISEPSFLVELANRTGAKILLDVNNIYVSCMNHGWSTRDYLNSIPADLVKEIHLAGHSQTTLSDGTIVRIDTHDDKVCDAVWDLYRTTIHRLGIIPTLLEWDAKIPPLEVLVNEACKVKQFMMNAEYDYAE